MIDFNANSFFGFYYFYAGDMARGVRCVTR